MRIQKTAYSYISDSTSPELSIIFLRSNALNQLNKKIKPLVPEIFRPHIEAANYINQTLTLITDSPVWYTRLRHLLPQIKEEICKTADFKELQTIKVKITNFTQVTLANVAQSKPTLSEKSARHIAEFANSLSSVELRKVFLQLTKRKTP